MQASYYGRREPVEPAKRNNCNDFKENAKNFAGALANL